MRQNDQVGGCGEHQVCAEEEEGELMGEIFYLKSVNMILKSNQHHHPPCQGSASVSLLTLSSRIALVLIGQSGENKRLSYQLQ